MSRRGRPISQWDALRCFLWTKVNTPKRVAYRSSNRAYAIAIWGAAAVCGPVLGPLIGAFAAQHKNWQWPIWELLWLSGFALVVLIMFLPETSSANILYRRTRRLRKITGRTDLKCEPELQGEGMTGKDIVMMTLVKPFSLIVLHFYGERIRKSSERARHDL